MGVVIFLALCSVLPFALVDAAVYDVVQFGAVGNGNSDDTQAFLKAWSATCADSKSPMFRVPWGMTFLLNTIVFEGPCKSNVLVEVLGNIVAPVWDVNAPHSMPWILFKGVNDLFVHGHGDVDGRGAPWWDCRLKGSCGGTPPDAFAFMNCRNSRLNGLSFTNSPAKHVTVYACSDIKIQKVKVTAPEESPNTDGMLVQESDHVLVSDCNIRTGDDCVAVGTGTSDVNITNVFCGPGHGISIGSLGKDFSESKVEDIRVSSCLFYNTSNGVRVKTWQGGSGYARRLSFQDVKFNTVQYPIIIDQYYCPEHNCRNYSSSVQLSDVSFVGARGTARGNTVGISLACSETVPCTGVVMEDVRIESAMGGGAGLGSYCLGVHGDAIGEVFPAVPCLK